MKKIWMLLFLLCLPLFAQNPYQQGRSGYAQNILWRDLHPSTQDSIRKAVADSLAALSVDGVTMLNDGTLKQKVFSDTTALKLASPDTLFSRVLLRGLNITSNKNLGGGVFVYADSAEMRAIYGSGANLISYPTAVAGKRLYREAALGDQPLNPIWFGADPTGTNDNVVAFTKMVAAGVGLNRQNYHIPKGTYDCAGNAIVISSQAVKQGFRLTGDGAEQTVINLTTDASNGIRVIRKSGIAAGGYNFIIDGLSVKGTGSATSTGRGISLDTTVTGVVQNCYISGHNIGIRVAQANALNVRNNYIENNKINVKLEKTSNEYTFLDNYIINSDSIEVVVEGGQLGHFQGGAVSGGPIAFVANTAAGLTISHVNVEQIDSLVIVVDGSAFVKMEKVNHVGNAVSTFSWGRVNSGQLLIEECEGAGGSSTNNFVYVAGFSSSRKIWQKGVTTFMIYDESNGLTYPVPQYDEVSTVSWNFITPDSANQGEWRRRRPPSSASLGNTGHLFYSAKVANGVYWDYVPGRVTDLRIAKTDSGEIGYNIENFVSVNWEFPFTTNATDTVVIKIEPTNVTLPTSIGSYFYKYQATVQVPSARTVIPTAAFWKVDNNRLIFIVYDGSSNGETLRMSVDVNLIPTNLDFYSR